MRSIDAFHKNLLKEIDTKFQYIYLNPTKI